MPYRLPEVLKQDPDRLLFIVEGEKCADALWEIDVAATTNPQGAGKWKDEYSEHLRGRHIIILPDNDDPGRNHAAEVARSLVGIAASVGTLELPDLPPKGDVVDWLAAGGDKDKLLKHAAEESCDQPESKSSMSNTELFPQPGAPAIADRPKIIVTTDEHIVNERAAAALASDQTIFQRGGSLVRVVKDNSPAAKDGIRRPFAPRIETLPTALLRERLSAVAQWVKECETDDGILEKPVHPPVWCVAGVHARGSWPGVRHLEAVVEYPVLRRDGSVLCQPGYDAETGLLLTHAGPLAQLPNQSDLDAAIAARDQLIEVFDDFPFERAVHRAGLLAALLTPLARFAFVGPAPLFLVDANVRGVGKGLLLDCIAAIITGQRFAIATYTDDENELRKRITSLALSGERLALFDNLIGKFGNAVLDAVLTATDWKDRVLGGNRVVQAPLYLTWYATGNNVSIAADTARRSCHIRLETPQERPEERRDFRHPNLLSWIGEQRQRLLACALTILRAYFVAGCPDQGLSAWGSYENWSKVVRGAVVWTGMPDPGETRLQLQDQADLNAGSMGVLLKCWEEMDPSRRGQTAAEAIDLFYKQPPESPPDFHADAKAALETLLDKPDARQLGNLLRSYRRRLFQGRFIDQVGKKHQAVRWAVFPADAF